MAGEVQSSKACHVLHNTEEPGGTLPHFTPEVHLMGAKVGNLLLFPQYEDTVEGTLLHFVALVTVEKQHRGHFSIVHYSQC